MYHSVLTLDPSRYIVRTLLRERRELHRFVLEHLHPDDKDEEKLKKGRFDSRYLFKLIQPDNQLPMLIIQSPNRPDLERMQQEAGMEGTEPVCRPCFQFYENLRPGRYKISAVIDPSHKREPSDRKFICCSSAGAVLRWLHYISQYQGFSFENRDLVLSKNTPLRIEHTYEQLMLEAKHPEKKKKTYAYDILSWNLEGTVTVTDPEKFRRVLQCGMGRSNGYGFGMVTAIPLDPAQEN